MATATYILRSKRDRGFALAAVMKAADGMQVRISKPTRTTEQNALLHVILTDVADQLAWPPDTGELHDVEWWKRRATLGWIKETRQAVEIITPLQQSEGEEDFAILLPHTSDLNVEQIGELIEWTYSFGAMNGVVFKEPKREEPPPPEDWR